MKTRAQVGWHVVMMEEDMMKKGRLIYLEYQFKVGMRYLLFQMYFLIITILKMVKRS